MKRLLQGLLAGVSSVTVAMIMPLAAGAATTTVVTPQQMNGWKFVDDQNDTTVTATGHMVTGPSTPPMGIGSAELETTSPNDGQALMKNDYGGKKFADLKTLTYSTYVTSGNNTIAPALQFSVDQDVTDGNTAWQGRIVFEPYLNTSTDNVGVTDGQWQTWNALNGKWWMTRPLGGFCAQASPCTMSDLIAKYPNIGVNGGPNQQVLFKAGSGWTDTFLGNVDGLTVAFGSNSTTYDFEPYQTPSNPDQCKKDGYKSYSDNNGLAFKNQGQCVSWSQHNVNGNGNQATTQNQ